MAIVDKKTAAMTAKSKKTVAAAKSTSSPSTPAGKERFDANEVKQAVRRAVSDVTQKLDESWDAILDKIEASDIKPVVWFSKTILRRISIEAPVIIGFCFICIVLHVLNITILPGLNEFLGVNSRFSASNPLLFMRLFTHVLAHENIPHLKGNMMNLLLVGPSTEAFFGSKAMLRVIGAVALTTAFAHMIFGRDNSIQFGASGVVFSVFLLNSLVSAKEGKIPLSFVVMAILYLGDELFKLFFATDRTSHHAHLFGGIVGCIAGFRIQDQLNDAESGGETKESGQNASSNSSGKNNDLTGILSGLFSGGAAKEKRNNAESGGATKESGQIASASSNSSGKNNDLTGVLSGFFSGGAAKEKRKTS